MNISRGLSTYQPDLAHALTQRDDAMPLSILLVEDDPFIQEVLVESLTVDGGYKVYAAGSLDQAQTLLSMNEERIGIILLDLKLPDGDGREFCAKLRRQSVTCPILLLSGLSDEDAIVSGFEAGADDYLVKPFGVGELLARVAVQRRAARLRGNAR